MKNLPPAKRLLRGYIVAGAFLLLVLGGYYFKYVPDRKAALRGRNFRLLAGISDNIKAEIAALPSVLTNSARSLKPNSKVEDLNRKLRNLVLLPLDTNQAASGPTLPSPRLKLGVDSLIEFDYRRDKGKAVVHAFSPLKQLIEPLASTPEFDDILVVAETGQVIYQREGQEFKFTQLNLPASALGRSFQTNLSLGSVESWTGKSASDAMLFVQPLRLSLGLTGTETNQTNGDWLVCGLVRSDNFLVRTMTIAYGWMIAIAFFLLVLLVGWPFLNLYFSRTPVLLKPRHLLIHYLCGGAACALATLGLFLTSGYRSIETCRDHEMEKLADSQVANFSQELDTVLRQMRAWDESFAAYPADKTNILLDASLCPVIGVQASNSPTWDPAFRMMVWIDANGMQTHKWTRDREPTPNIKIDTRAYFKNILTDQVWTKQVNDETRRFFIEPVFSRNTGENSAEVSMRSSGVGAAMAALDIRFQTFFQPVLPVDVGFCVIDDQGDVLFHSDENRNLRENFFTECENDAAVLALVHGRKAGVLDGSYLGKFHNFAVKPIDDLPWTLILFREEQKLQTLLLDTASTVAPLSCIALMFGVAGGVILYLSTQKRDWLWPVPHRRSLYQGFIITAGLFSGLAWMALPRHHDLTILILALSLPCAGLFLFWLTCRMVHPPKATHHLPGKTDLRWYCVAIAMLLFTSIVVPTAIFCGLLLNGEAGLMVKRGQMHFSRQMAERKDRLENDYRDVQAPERFIDWRTSSCAWDCYSTPFFETTIETTVIPQIVTARHSYAQTDAIYELRGLRPLFNSTAKEITAYVDDGDNNGLWKWEHNRGKLTLYAQDTGRDRQPGEWGQVITSNVWTLSQINPFSLCVTALGCLVVASIVAWRMAIDFFILRAPYQEIPPQRSRILFLGKSGKPLRSNFDIFRWKAGKLELERRAQPGEQSDHVWIEDFAADCGSSEATQSKLRELQKLAADPRKVIVIHSEIHPLNFQFGAPGDSESGSNDRADWANLIASFRTIFSAQLAKIAKDEDKAKGKDNDKVRKRPDFNLIWAASSPLEKRVLFELSGSTVLNPKQPEIFLLHKRGIILLDPVPKVSNAEFEKWIRANARPAELEVVALTTHTWGAVKGPLIFGVVGCALIFFLTQKTLWNNTIALLPAFAVGLSGIISVGTKITELKGSKPGNAPKSSDDS